MSHVNKHIVDEKVPVSQTFESVFITAEIIVIVLFALCANYETNHGFHGQVDEFSSDAARQYI